MSLFKNKPDPIAEQEKALRQKIEALQSEIQGLNQRIESEQSQPRLRSTARAGAAGAPDHPAFEEVNVSRVPPPAAGDGAPQHYNDLGVRKYDIAAAVRRWLNHLHGTPPPNPKLVNFLASGSIHGLRPLRYEKRVARYRFMALCAVLLAALWGLSYFYLRQR